MRRDCFNVRWSRTMVPFMGCGIKLTYNNQARAIMNSHFLGPDHGIQSEKLCQQVRCRSSYVPCYNGRSRISYTETRKIAIIDDELFVSISREYASTNGNNDDLIEVVGVLLAIPCGHVYKDVVALIPDVDLDGHHTPGSCGTCLTDWEETVHHQHDSGDGDDRVGWKVTLSSFHQLGSCRSPDDWKWANLIMSQSGMCLDRSETRNHIPGSVRRKWTLGLLQLNSADCQLDTLFTAYY